MNLRELVSGAGVVCLLGTVWAAPAPAEPVRYGDYIVVLDAGAPAFAQRFVAVSHVYSAALDGFAARLSEEQAAALARESGVDAVVPDTPVRALGEQVGPPSWGLDRIDQRERPLDDVYRYPNGGAGVTAYVLDTGVAAGHADFGGRVLPGVDVVDGDGVAEDGNGHGTFVAGLIGGQAHGVAKEVEIVPVRVLDDSGAGSVADVIAGIDWVTANATGPAVANLSLGGGPNAALDAAVRASIASGVTFAVAAGGSATDAAGFSPARVAEALTAGASGRDDCLSPSTNHGAVVDVFAPGVDIVGPWRDGGTATLSGSSLAAPHVAGAAAIHLADHPAAAPAEVSAALVADATRDVLCGVPPGTPNRLLHVG